MHIVDYGYDRDLQRLDVAVRFIRHEARTRTIRQWTGLSDDRIRKLYHSYLRAGGSTVRHRGQSPRQATYFLRSSRMRAEASTLASLCCLVGLFDPEAFSPCRQRATDVERAAALCVAYERYRATVHDPAITFEHAVLLVSALARGNELRLGDCRDCGALQVVDWLELRPTRCGLCSAGLARGPADLARPAAAVPHNSATPNT